ncbi:hypothetical protein HDU96_007969 [Phlyctochytrium bullatum]|nr:hypothetical protein HDU96_007969 [Phlyctochytrium bullatum]
MAETNKGIVTYSEETKSHGLKTEAVVTVNESDLLAVASELERMERKRLLRLRIHRFLAGMIVFGVLYHCAHMLGIASRSPCSRHRMPMAANDEPEYKYPETPDLIPSKEFEPAIYCNPEAMYPVYPDNGSLDLPPVADDPNEILKGAMMVLNITVRGAVNAQVTVVPEEEDEVQGAESKVARADIHFHFADKDLIPNVTLTSGWYWGELSGFYGINITGPDFKSTNTDDELGNNGLPFEAMVPPPSLFGYPRVPSVPSDIDFASAAQNTDNLLASTIASQRAAVKTPCIIAVVRIKVPKRSFQSLKLFALSVDEGSIHINLDGDRVEGLVAYAGLGVVSAQNLEARAGMFGGLFLFAGLGVVEAENVSTRRMDMSVGFGNINANDIFNDEIMNITGGFPNVNFENVNFSTFVSSNITHSGYIELTGLNPRSAETFESIQARTLRGTVSLDEVRMPLSKKAAGKSDGNEIGLVSAVAALGPVSARVIDFHGSLAVVGKPARVKGTELDLTTNTQQKVQGTRALSEGEKPPYRFVAVSGDGVAEAMFE